MPTPGGRLPDVMALIVGLAGTLLGIGLKALFDLLTERSRRKREDIVWRRQHALEAAASFLEAAGAVHALGRTISDSADDFIASQQAGHNDVLREKRDRLEMEKAQKRASLEQAHNALSRLSLLLQQKTYLVASQYLEAVTHRFDNPATSVDSAYLNDLLRADLGLPGRVITDAAGITVEEFYAKVHALRQKARGQDLTSPTP